MAIGFFVMMAALILINLAASKMAASQPTTTDGRQ